MIFGKISHPNRLLLATAASLLVLNLSACNKQEPRSDSVGKDLAKPAETPGQATGQQQSPGAMGQQQSQSAPTPGGATNQKDRAVDNAELAAKVKSALLAEPGLHDLKIDSAHGVVTLRGKADTSETRDKAEKLALNVEGVTAVQNELEVANRS